jgi:aminomethyltransferase
MKRTPLFEAHQRLGGRLIEFGGWEMPVQYSGIVDEHQSVRTAAGLFDISHMGEVFIEGAGAVEFLNRLLTNNAKALAVGDAQYSLMCNERGGVIDDLYVYRVGDTAFLLIINASRIEADVEWIRQQAAMPAHGAGAAVRDVAAAMGAVAVQGPVVIRFIDQLVAGAATGGTRVQKPTELRKNQMASFPFGTGDLYVARTGYTGEDGFEVVAPAASIAAVWNRLLELGAPHGLKPAGLGARDTLRTEMCYPLYGHELDENTTPIEAGVGFFVALDKGDFNGREVLAKQKADGCSKKLVAFKMVDKSAPPRPAYRLFAGPGDAEPAGLVTSGTQSPSLGLGIGLGYVSPGLAKTQTPLQVEIRGRRFSAVTASKPLYRKPS